MSQASARTRAVARNPPTLAEAAKNPQLANPGAPGLNKAAQEAREALRSEVNTLTVKKIGQTKIGYDVKPIPKDMMPKGSVLRSLEAQVLRDYEGLVGRINKLDELQSGHGYTQELKELMENAVNTLRDVSSRAAEVGEARIAELISSVEAQLLESTTTLPRSAELLLGKVMRQQFFVMPGSQETQAFKVLKDSLNQTISKIIRRYEAIGLDKMSQSGMDSSVSQELTATLAVWHERLRTNPLIDKQTLDSVSQAVGRLEGVAMKHIETTMKLSKEAIEREINAAKPRYKRIERFAEELRSGRPPLEDNALAAHVETLTKQMQGLAKFDVNNPAYSWLLREISRLPIAERRQMILLLSESNRKQGLRAFVQLIAEVGQLKTMVESSTFWKFTSGYKQAKATAESLVKEVSVSDGSGIQALFDKVRGLVKGGDIEEIKKVAEDLASQTVSTKRNELAKLETMFDNELRKLKKRPLNPKEIDEHTLYLEDVQAALREAGAGVFDHGADILKTPARAAGLKPMRKRSKLLKWGIGIGGASVGLGALGVVGGTLYIAGFSILHGMGRYGFNPTNVPTNLPEIINAFGDDGRLKPGFTELQEALAQR
ncbi:MAG: hypothetical protein R3C68_11075 [Myxococcota bacterium]